MAQYNKGYFKAKHPEKYMGNPKGIVYRSGWEFKFMMKLDHDPKVIRWASEEFSISYISPKDKKWHRYFPDFYYETITGDKYLIEIKPFAQCHPPKQGKSRNRKKLINEVITYETNRSKWAYAQKWCEERNIRFQVLTEKELFK